MATRKRTAGFLAALCLAMASSCVFGAPVTYEYDANGRLDRATYDDGTIVDYSYDANGNRTAAIVTVPQDFVPPSAPATLAAVAVSQTQINLSWSPATDNVRVTRYTVERCAGADCTSFSAIATPTSNNHPDAGRAPNTTYVYRVKAQDAAGNESGYSPTASATTASDAVAPSAPGMPSFTNITMTSVTASWSAATDNIGVTGYEYRLNSGIWNFANVLSVGLSGLAPATNYTFQVRARDAAGNVGPASSGSFRTPDTAAPSVPTGLSAVAPSSSTVNLSWTAATDNVAVTGYRVFRNGAQIGTSATNAYADNTVSGKTTYSYRVSAYDAAGNSSAQSTAVSIATPDTIAPTAAPNLTAQAVSPTQVNLQWGASTDSGGSDVAGYRIYRNGSHIGTTNKATRTFSNTSLSPSTTYSYTVRAYDDANNVSPASNAVSVTTSAPLQAAVSSTSWEWYSQLGQPVQVSPNVVVTASGGSGGYTYAWERVSGDTQTTVVSPTARTTAWSRTVPSYHVDYRSVWRCRVLDSSGGVVYTPNVTVNFRKENLD